MDYKDFGFTVSELKEAMITLNKMNKDDIMETLENKQYLIELSDEEYQIINRKELIQAEQSAEDYDGFLGFTIIGCIDDIKDNSTTCYFNHSFDKLVALRKKTANKVKLMDIEIKRMENEIGTTYRD